MQKRSRTPATPHLSSIKVSISNKLCFQYKRDLLFYYNFLHLAIIYFNYNTTLDR